MSTAATIYMSASEANGKIGVPKGGELVNDLKENLQKSSTGTPELVQQNGGHPYGKEEEQKGSEVDVTLKNVVCSFSVRCNLNLKQIAMNANNVEFLQGMAMLIMKFRRPRSTATIWSSGKITISGATSENNAKTAAERCARTLQKLGFHVRLTDYRIVNVLATCKMPFAVKIADFAQEYPRIVSYEPEIHPGVTYKMRDITATLKIFSTGNITIYAPSVKNVQLAVQHIYNLLYERFSNRK